MAEGSSRYHDRLLLLSKVKKLCLCFLPLFLGYLFLQNTLNIEEPLAVSTGRSMEPNIREGDILVFRGVTPEEIEVGDVILFEVPEEMGELLPPRIAAGHLRDPCGQRRRPQRGRHPLRGAAIVVCAEARGDDSDTVPGSGSAVQGV